MFAPREQKKDWAQTQPSTAQPSRLWVPTVLSGHGPAQAGLAWLGPPKMTEPSPAQPSRLWPFTVLSGLGPAQPGQVPPRPSTAIFFQFALLPEKRHRLTLLALLSVRTLRKKIDRSGPDQPGPGSRLSSRASAWPNPTQSDPARPSPSRAWPGRSILACPSPARPWVQAAFFGYGPAQPDPAPAKPGLANQFVFGSHLLQK